MADDSTKEIPALGRPFQVGMLYDCRDDKLIPGCTLWDPVVIQKHTAVRDQCSNEINFVSSNSFEDKAKSLGMSDSLKTSLLVGLVDVSGSANFILDQNENENDASLTLQSKNIVRHEQLSLKDVDNGNVSDQIYAKLGNGTHVVSAISYGVQAFFVFNRSLINEDKEQTNKYFDTAIRSIPNLTKDFEAQLEVKKIEKKHIDLIRCKYFGDVNLEKNPENYEDAVKVFLNFPKSVEEQDCVPLSVWLCPISNIDNKVAKFFRELSLNISMDIQQRIESLGNCIVKSGNLEAEDICKDFPCIAGKLKVFMERVIMYMETYKQKLARALPDVRGGKGEEETLKDIILECDGSPFSIVQLKRWLKIREKEMNIVKAHMKELKSLDVIRTQEELQDLVVDPNKVFVVCLSFSSVEHEDEYLNVMSSYLQSPNLHSAPFTVGKAWFEDPSVSRKSRSNAKQFKQFASANLSSDDTTFVVMSIDDGEQDNSLGASIFVYDNGVLISKDFQPPGIPVTLEMVGATNNTISLRWTHPNSGVSNINAYKVRYNKKTESANEPIRYLTRDTQSTEIVITNLKPNSLYEFAVSSCCDIGQSSYSVTIDARTTLVVMPKSTTVVSRTQKTYATYENINIIKDRPGSASELICRFENTEHAKPLIDQSLAKCQLEIIRKTHDTITLKWPQPNLNTRIQFYRLKYREVLSIESLWTEITTSYKTTNTTIKHLKPNTKYEFFVDIALESGVCCPLTSNGELCSTLPSSPPSGMRVKKVTKRCVDIAFERPRSVGEGIKIEKYKIKLTSVFPNESEQSPHEIYVSKPGTHTIENLKPGTSYKIWVIALCADTCENALPDPLEFTTTPDLPLAPTQPEAHHLSHNEISLKWTHSNEDSSEVTTYIIKYREKDGFEEGWVEFDTRCKDTATTIMNLKSNTTYEFSVAGACAVGRGQFSRVSDAYTTLTARPRSSIATKYRPKVPPRPKSAVQQMPESPRNIIQKFEREKRDNRLSNPTVGTFQPTIYDKTHNSVTLKWSYPNVDAPIQYFRVRYRENSFNDNNWSESRVSYKHSGVTIYRLQPCTMYEFLVDVGFESGFCQPMSERSELGLTLPASPPSNVRSTHVSDTSVDIAWDQPNCFGNSVAVSRYKIKTLQLTGAHINQSTIETTANDVCAYTLQDLIPDTTYMINVAASCGNAGESALSEPHEIITSSDLPLAPGKPTIIRLNYTEISLEWSEPIQGSSSVTTYVMKYRKTSSNDGTWVDFDTKSTATKARIPNLEPNTSYEFSVAGLSKTGLGEFSAASDNEKTLSSSPPSKPRKVQVTNNKIKVIWDRPTSLARGVRVIEYRLEYHRKGDSNIQHCLVNENSPANTIEDLDPGTMYNIKVCAVCNNESSSSYSEAVEIATDSKPLPVPGKPTVLDIVHDTVSLEWSSPIGNISNLQGYLVKYQEKATFNGKNFDCQSGCKANTVTINKLKPNITYIFSVASDYGIATSELSIASDPCTTLVSSPPLNVRKKEVSQSSIKIVWTAPDQVGNGLFITNYRIKYQRTSVTKAEQYMTKETENDTCFYDLQGVMPNTSYKIRVCAVCGQTGESVFSQPIEVTSASRIASEIANYCELQSQGDPKTGTIAVYKLPLKGRWRPSTIKYQNYFFGDPVDVRNQHFVIMVVGATGAGKSTLINGMINYILQVDWSDDFRFKIVVEEGENKCEGQAKSQNIVSYTINPPKGANVEFRLTIIDTPGFGDTSGIERDKQIFDQIREFFTDATKHKVDHINTVCFVAQASQSRLTHTQRYVFDSILALFGKDIESNIVTLITFADGQKPPVIEALKKAKIPCPNENLFKFNNSALFANKSVSHTDDKEDLDGSFEEMFWKMGTKSMKKFFTALKHLTAKSLTLTKEVLEERKRLQIAIEGLQPQIQLGCKKLEELRQEKRVLEQHEADIEANKDFEYEVQVTLPIKIDIKSGEFLTNCQRCHFTCHYPCAFSDDKDKIRCLAMDHSTGNCTVCTEKCPWNVHYNQKYRFEYTEQTQKKTFGELQERYHDATGKKLTAEQVIKNHEQELKIVQDCVFDLILRSHKSLSRLEEIALRPNPLSAVDYIDLLIDTEQREGQRGWKERVQSLQEVRAHAEITGELRDPGYDPFQAYRDLIPPPVTKKSGKRGVAKKGVFGGIWQRFAK